MWTVAAFQVWTLQLCMMCCGPPHVRMVLARAGSLEPGMLLPQAATRWGVRPCCSMLGRLNVHT